MVLRDRVVDTAISLGIDDQLRALRATVHPVHRKQRADDKKLRLLLQSTLTHTSNCIDIGAYRGRVLAEMVRVAPNGQHIAYEPSPRAYDRLLIRFPAVDVRCAAVSNEVGETTFTYVKGQPGRSGLRERSLSGRHQVDNITVRQETLDRSLPPGYKPALIKIDVEGAERQVFEGAIETICRYKPVIVFEHGKGGAPHFGTQPHHIYELLHDQAGLEIYDMDGLGPYSLALLEASFALDEQWDYVARPR
jgi:FkbM family methyltransferase